MAPLPKALAFDVFGTVVDWRTSVARESAGFLEAIGLGGRDPAEFADAWRAQYIAAMIGMKASGREFVVLDVLHREMLEATLRDCGADPATLDESLLADWNRAWHRLDPWPDTVAGLTRLKARFPILTLSNGNIALLLAMARRAGLPWDAILGAEVSGFYKPDRRAYLHTAEVLGIAPGELCLVAAHHGDLAAARAAGLQCAYVDRPQEYGGAPAPDAHHEQAWEWSATSLTDLADQLGC
ncbi:haloacid dehalogenase type II [Erythrobacter donghaensis]|uniref:haloacid dehalogenase type II n=1 Tax=Erythrobacter donghaensis TaxID=267135 RepID=UPI000A392DFE|nr:haloacid dehalogenase type II [Erythrobacter donghaensis]